MSINLKDTFERVSWADDQGLSHAELIEDHAFNYGMKDGAESIGQIGRTNETDDARETAKNGKSKKEKERRLREIIDRAMDSFFNDMDNWSAQDFQNFNKDFSKHMRDKAKNAYEAGDFASYVLIMDFIDEYDRQTDKIWNDPNLTEEEKIEANQELINDMREENPAFAKSYIAENAEKISYSSSSSPKTSMLMDDYTNDIKEAITDAGSLEVSGQDLLSFEP